MERRKFISKSTLAILATSLGSEIVFGANLPEELKLLGLQDPDPYALFKKNKGLRVLSDKPWNMEPLAHHLDEEVTSNQFIFVRNNGLVPTKIDPTTWTLTIDGESVKQIKTYSLAELKSKFKHYSYQLVIECGGNGRAEFDPPTKGNQWDIGAVYCAKWTGVRLKDVLNDVGVKPNAVYIGYHAADVHLSGDLKKEPISRGIPIAKAMQEETLLAFQMNDQDIPFVHGHPLRLVAGGYPASVSGKWLQKISVRDKIHDGEKMGGDSYRIPCTPVSPGEEVKDADMCIIESMPVKSLITYPKSGGIISKGKKLTIRGHAWAGELEVSKMEYSIDFGMTWKSGVLRKPSNRLAWQHFSAIIDFPKIGYYEVWAKATDSQGKSQPMIVPGWNPKGYLNNACHRIAIKVS